MAYCRHCGKPLPAGAWTCASCGQSVGGAYAGQQTVPPPFHRRVVRPRAGRKVAGVCQGLANTYGWDVTFLRNLTVLLSFFSGIGVLAYVVIWVIAPEEQYALPPVTSYPPAS